MAEEHRTQSGDTGERLEARVVGRVQGVGFRAFVRDEARRLGLRGGVWNGDDGAVYVVAEGPRPALEALRARLEQGPSMAHPTGVEVQWRGATGVEPAPFRVSG